MGYLRPTPFSVRSVSAGRVSRRRALARLTQVGAGAMLAALPGGGARSNVSEVLEPTPSQVEGPFYPQNKPVDADWNLLDVASASVPPAGKPLGLQGRVLDTVGRPLAHTTVEIWQSDNQGVYDHPRAEERDRFDRRFQGYGASATGNEGRYRFLTIMPVPYTGRPPHIHVKIRRKGAQVLTTQLYLKDHPENDRDGLLSLLFFRNQDDLLIDPQDAEMPNGARGKTAHFDFVIG